MHGCRRHASWMRLSPTVVVLPRALALRLAGYLPLPLTGASAVTAAAWACALTLATWDVVRSSWPTAVTCAQRASSCHVTAHNDVLGFHRVCLASTISFPLGDNRTLGPRFILGFTALSFATSLDFFFLVGVGGPGAVHAHFVIRVCSVISGFTMFTLHGRGLMFAREQHVRSLLLKLRASGHQLDRLLFTAVVSSVHVDSCWKQISTHNTHIRHKWKWLCRIHLNLKYNYFQINLGRSTKDNRK